jgi:hypothetical protein
MIVSGWVHQQQVIVIEFLQAANRLLKERLRGKRIRFTDAERVLLARKAKAVGRKALLRLDTIVTPDTLMRWHKLLVGQKWDYSKRRGVVSTNWNDSCGRLSAWVQCAAAHFLADGCIGLGPSPAVDRHRVPSSREPHAEGAPAREAHTIH